MKVYTDRMVKKKSPGRSIYERILLAPKHRICPFCGIGTANTLDHYLPKSEYPVYAVNPSNLVPCCEWCQGEKKEYYPRSKGKQLLHPYFDDVENELWLTAEVVEGVPASFRYFASPPDTWATFQKRRLDAHLKELNLNELFSINAGSRLSEIRSRLIKLHQKGGEIAVREHLSEELESMEADHLNSWTSAMYRAAIESDWFCEGGFRDT
ncbi:MAG: hypothetical protein HUJ26_00625 [Planctomycetaceae bacterium]|nr:hypothetical protein [Planctomycetaceae bacterium]